MRVSTKKKFLNFVFLISTAVFLSGCFSIESGRVGVSGDEQVLVSNYGWYLFHFIPLACGNANEDGYLPWVFFRNDVTVDKVQHRFFSRVNTREDDVKVDDLAYRTYETVLFEVPGSNIPIPLPYVLTYKEIQLSGVLVPEKGALK